jgi:hypothetical protein
MSPRNVRNWWITGRADGQKSSVGFGPAAGDGGFDLVIYQRNRGEAEEAVEILGRWIDGTLRLTVRAANKPSPVLVVESQR